MEREQYIKEQVLRHYNYIKDKYDVLYLGLQGSQNYGLDVYDTDYKSDVDTKAIVLPSFKDIVYNRQPVSKTVVLENDEHIDVKDIRVMFENFKKQNINFLEILFTDFYVINEEYKKDINYLRNSAEQIARLNINQALRCMAGMSKEKLKALKHPYPATIDKIEKYGYDPKQLHHILRMNDFIKKYGIQNKKFKDCLIPDNKDYLIQIKKGLLSEQDATMIAENVDKDTYNIKEKLVVEQDIINKTAIDILNEIKYNILKQKFKKELLEEN